MSYKVFWTPEAEEKFNENISYLESEWTESVIDNFINKTEDALKIICSNPRAFPAINKKKGVHKCLLVKQVSLYYRIVEQRVELITFWNNYQDPNKLQL